MTEGVEVTRGIRKERKGLVISKSGDKSIVVQVETRKRHAKYGKVVTQQRKFHAHDEENAAKVGDQVTIIETRPLSKLKRWRLGSIVQVS
jgi:small subunit ribosomal protein S17